jgi:hypothetical protein
MLLAGEGDLHAPVAAAAEQKRPGVKLYSIQCGADSGGRVNGSDPRVWYGSEMGRE